MMIMAAMTTAEVASEFDTDARTLRKFLRSEAGKNSKVGKGARWSIEKRELRSLRTRFAKWDEARKATETDEAPEIDTNEDDALDTE
jgi:hypothetical protein